MIHFTLPNYLVLGACCLHLQHGQGSTGNKIAFSGPLLVSSKNVDQMLREHDRQIQESVRRARLGKVQAQGKHVLI